MIDTFSPMPGWALVNPLDRKVSPAGLILPESLKKNRSYGRVMALTCPRKNGVLVDYGFQPGDMILLPKFEPKPIEVAGETLELVKCDDVIAKLEGTPKDLGEAWIQ